MDKKVIVISGVNLIDAGPLSVFLDFLDAIVEEGYAEKYRIIALIGKKELFTKFEGKVQLVEYRKAKSSWLYRIYLEYFGFNTLSKKMNVYAWISMHDTTPNVKAMHRFVYCHNPSPFNKMSIKDARFGIKYFLFSKFYKYLYKINIEKNDAVIVQQDWMRQEFIKMYHLKNVIVARPSMPKINMICNKESNENIFICPSFPRYYKNFQISCEAAKKLNDKGIHNFKVYITLNGDENKYAKYLKSKYASIPSVNFCGLLSRDKLFELYAKSACLIFMSKLETWGMPITEYKFTNKPIIVADLPYAHETVGTYNSVAFVDPNDIDSLADNMVKVIKRDKLHASIKKDIKEPYATNWAELCSFIFAMGDGE